MSDEIYSRLTELFRELFDDESLEATPALTASDVPGWDSLMHVRLMLSVERTFHIRISASDIGKLKTVGDLADLIARKTPA
jgi:acyl carrier protein